MRSKNTAGRKDNKRFTGQGIVEFALVLPLFLMVIYGVIEFGRLLFVYTAVTTATRATLTGSDVTIFMANGDFSTGGDANSNLAVPPAGCPPSITGMLMYIAESNAGIVTLQGCTTSTFEGVIFAPTGTIDVSGGSSAMPTVQRSMA